MPQIKNYIYVLILMFSISVSSQNTIENDPEIVQDNIEYRITEALKEIENYNYYEAQNKLDEALELSIKHKDRKSEGVIHALKGKLQLIEEEEEKAIASLTKAVEIQREISDNINIGNSYKIFGDIYLKKKEFILAHDSYKAAKTHFEEQNLTKNLAEVLLCEGRTFMELKNYTKARNVIDKSITIAKDNDLFKTQSLALIYLAKTNKILGNTDSALISANEGIGIAKANKFHSILDEGYLTLSNINESIENHQLSLNYLKAHNKLSDSLRGVERSHWSKEKKNQLLLAESNKKIEELEKNAEEDKTDKEFDTLISILSVALITILSLLTLSLYKNNNIRLKTNNMLHKKNGELIVAKEKAELASKTKANFLSTVTHELRTPLYAVTGLSNMLLDENPKPEQVQHLKSLKFSGDYLLTFINDILQINKIEANKVDIEPEPFNLKKKINNIILALNNSANDNNIKLHFEFDKELPENFIADQLKISQILINLIGNSIKFTKDGDIWIRVYKIGQKDNTFNLRFEVEDNGIGISKEKQDNMFESFSQGSIQINRKYGGTGLGLSIVKGLIDILKGDIYLKSELGKGSTFYFEIPVEYAEEKTNKRNKVDLFNGDTSELDLTNVKILVVEDNKINQMITKKILTKMNLNCDIVDNGEGAVDLIKANDYNIILMDIHMPGISGIEATKIVRTFDKELTIFALTAVTIEDKMHEFEEAGFTDIIPKPFKQEEFERKLYNALTGKNKSETA